MANFILCWVIVVIHENTTFNEHVHVTSLNIFGRGVQYGLIVKKTHIIFGKYKREKEIHVAKLESLMVLVSLYIHFKNLT